MAFVRLTDSNGHPVIVNLDHVIVIYPAPGGRGSTLHFAKDKFTMFVKEEPDIITLRITAGHE